MTMPHLMNCDHSGGGWCLDCVARMHDELTAERNAWKRECYRRIRVCYGRPGTASIEDCIEGSEQIVAEELAALAEGGEDAD